MEYQRYNYAKQDEFRQERWENNNGQDWTWMYRNDQDYSSVDNVLELRLYFRLAECSGLWPKEMCELDFTLASYTGQRACAETCFLPRLEP